MRVVKKRLRWKWGLNEFLLNHPAVIVHGLAHITLVISQARWRKDKGEVIGMKAWNKSCYRA